MKRLILFVLILMLMFVEPINANAKTVNRYTTQTVALKDKAKGKVIYKVKRNTKVRQISVGKAWARVKYKGKKLYVRKKYLSKLKSPKKYTGAYFKRAGVINWKGYKYTWYSQRVLSGNGLKIKGRHVDKQGFVCDQNNYIVLGSNVANRGKIVATPFGKFGRVYDVGYVTTNWFDCYVAW